MCLIEIFSLTEAIDRGIDKFCFVEEQNQIIELVFINGTLAPYALWYVHDNIFRLPIAGFEATARSLTYINGITSYSEYFERYIIHELIKKVSAMRKRCRRN